MNNLGKSLLISLASLIFTLFLFELIYRLFFTAPSDNLPAWSDRPRRYFMAEGSTDFRDYAYSDQKPAGVFRIAVVGDSYSFAPYMQFTDAFPKVLERMLNLAGSQIKAEVINYGVPAYSTAHEVALVEKAIRQSADLIILQVTLNDPELKPYRPTGLNLNQIDKFGPLKLSPFWEKVTDLFRSWRFILERLHNLRTHRAYKEYFIDLFKNKKTFDHFKQSIEKISKTAIAANTKIVAVIFPLFGLPLDNKYPFFEIHKIAGDVLKETGIKVLDLYEPFKGIPLERLQVIVGVDRHPNEIAHRISAEAIYDWLEAEGILPDDLRIKNFYKERIGLNPKSTFASK
ncbi:MAG TPA: hypothetical protein PKD37_00250 [Oligoflexia bacterium]|nr:hypothetical protein [Oligoflexia bacterium]HMP26411.1 hypothetical protein [Oligoflexia bacterium]